MNAFSAALDVLFADPNMAEDVLYTPVAGPPVTVRAVVVTPDQEARFGNVVGVVPTVVLRIRAADLTPAEGDQVEVRGTVYGLLGKPERKDSRGLVWTCGLIPADL